MAPPHQTLTDKTIEFPDLTPDEAAFLAKVQAKVADPQATEDDVVGRENPEMASAAWRAFEPS